MLAVHDDRQPHLGIFPAAEHAHLTGDVLIGQSAFGETQPHFAVFHRRELCPEGIERRFL